MTTKNQKKALAVRFSIDDWQTICNSVEFLDALERSVEAAEIVAHKILAKHGMVQVSPGW